MLGHLKEWLFSGLGGISQTEQSTAFDEIQIAPQPVGTVNYAHTEYTSVHGRIAAEWSLKDGRYTLSVDIPTNSTATIILPTADVDSVTDYGVPAKQSDCVSLIGTANGQCRWHVGSGRYFFEVALQPDGIQK